MAEAKWSIDSDGDLKLTVYYQAPCETSSGTSGCSRSYYAPLTTLERTAKKVIAMASERFFVDRMIGIDDWKTVKVE